MTATLNGHAKNGQAPASPDRLPPRSQQAERAVLGAMLRDNGQIPFVSELLTAADFYEDAHQKLFAAVMHLHETQQPVDLVTLSDELFNRKQIDDVGGYAYVGELLEASPTGGNAVYYANIVRDRALARNLIHASNEIMRDAYDQSSPAQTMVEEAERRIMAIGGRSAGAVEDAPTGVRDAFVRIDARQQASSRGMTGLETGFVDLDAITCGWQPGNLIAVGARPRIGKTTIGMNFALHVAVQLSGPVLFVTLEQSKEELWDRALCYLARVSGHRMRKGMLGTEELVKVREAGDRLMEAPLFVADDSDCTLSRLGAKARRVHAKQHLRLIILDYLQLMRPSNARESRQEQVSGFSRGLKFLARELAVPVIALAQFNREVENRTDQKPRLSDFRESGGVENDCDLALLLHRPREEGSEHRLEVQIAKHRNGPEGEITLAHSPQWFRFENFAQGTPYDERTWHP